MRQLNLPKKRIACGQVWISIVLILLSAFFAFTPLVSIDMSTSSLRETVNNGIDTFGANMKELKGMEIPEQVDVTTFKTIKAIKVFTKLLQVSLKEAMSSGSTQSDADQQKLKQAKEDLKQEMDSEEGREAIVMTIALFGQVADFSNNQKTNDTTLDESDNDQSQNEKSAGSMALLNMVKASALLYLVLFTLAFPFFLLIDLLIKLIKALSCLKTPEKISAKVCGTLTGYITLTIVMMLVLTLFPGIGWGSGLMVLFVLAIVNILINFCATRLRSYSPSDFNYVNLVQGAAIIELIGFGVFFSNLLKAGVFQSFLSAVGTYMQGVLRETAIINEAISAYNEYSSSHISPFVPGITYLADAILLIIYASMAIFVSCSIIRTISASLGFTANKKSGKIGISAGIAAIITCLVPMATTMLKNAKSFSLAEIKNGAALIHEETTGTVYVMSDSSRNALIGMLMGGLIILAVGIAFQILKKKFCGEITDEQEFAILCANAPARETTAPTETAAQEETTADSEEPTADSEESTQELPKEQ